MKAVIQAIPYDDMGEKRTIILHCRDEAGRLMCLLSNGKPIDDLCPCCMSDMTRSKIAGMIKGSGIEKVIWVSNYGHNVQEYIPELHSPVKLSETEFEYSV